MARCYIKFNTCNLRTGGGIALLTTSYTKNKLRKGEYAFAVFLLYKIIKERDTEENYQNTSCGIDDCVSCVHGYGV